MSFAIDADVLLYASDASSPKNAAAASFLGACAESGGLFCLAWPTIIAYLQIATHPKTFAAPLAPQQAEQNIQQLLGLGHCRVIDGSGIDFWATYTTLSRDYHPRGNRVPDLQLAAILKANGIKRLFTCDRDFRRFDFLEIIDPTRS